MDEMIITSAQYKNNENGETVCIEAVIENKTYHVPISEGNRHYDEIMRQVEAGELTIADAE